MKNILIYIWVIVTVGLFAGCENSDIDHSYGGPWFLAFRDATQQALESAPQAVKVEVQLVAPLQKKAVNVNFELSSEDLVSGKDYKLVNETNTLTFEPGELIKYVEVQLFDNLDITGDRKLNIKLTSTDADVRIGQPGEGNKRDVCVLVVKDDDCPFTMETFSGRVNGYETTPWWNDVKFPATFTPIELLGPDRIKYNVKGIFFSVQLEYAYNAWLAGTSDQAVYKDVEVIIDYSDKNNPTISWESQPSVTVISAGESTDYWVAASKEAPLKLSTCDQTMSFSYTMVNPSWASSYSFNVSFNFKE